MFSTPVLQDAQRAGTEHIASQQRDQGMTLQKLMGRYGVQNPEGVAALMGQYGKQANAGALNLRGNLNMQQAIQMFQQDRLDRFYRQLAQQKQEEDRAMIGGGLGAFGGILGGLLAPTPQQNSTASWLGDLFGTGNLNQLGQTYQSAPSWFTQGRKG